MQPYRPLHRGPTVTARVSTGGPAPRKPFTFGAELVPAEADGLYTSALGAARPTWQPQWKWLPLVGSGDFCFRTKWFWRTLATARPSMGGEGIGPEAAQAASEAWKRQQRDAGIASGKQYGRWEQGASGQKRWVKHN